MTSTIKVDNIENQCGGAVVTKCGATTTISGSVVKADDIQAADGGNIINQCGTTITLGASGDTINLASGASQSGFGRTGTVDWDTTVKTSSFTATSGDGYFVNTTSGAITVTLPASPSANDIVSIADYAGTAATNNITIARNGSNFEGGTENGAISTNRQTATLIFVDSTQGWIVVNSNDQSFIAPAFITATGGTITTCGDFKVHKFTGPGTFTVCSVGNPLGSDSVDYFVVAGGGAGSRTGGGGGGGGFRLSQSTYCCASPIATPTALPVTAQSYPITVGAGGAAQDTDNIVNNPGANSIFSTITSAGGGGAHSYANSTPGIGGPGGSGGGGGTADGSLGGPAIGGTGNTPPVSPPQGNPGGQGSPTRGGGGGGGAGATGSPSGGPNCGGSGAIGTFIPTSALGPAAPGVGELGPAGRYFSGGGGGSQPSGTVLGGLGGAGDGGNNPNPAAAGTANTGGGGGGTNNSGGGTGGGSGIVIIRYKFQ
jgi:hypothetical protein